MNILAIIGARSGSKSVPDKNIKSLAGKPLMAWIIEAARRSVHVNRVIVSTDSDQYADIARRFGAETPFLRPAAIAGDKATDFEYVSHALAWLKEHEGYVPDVVVRLMPTTPLQSTADIDGCIEQLLSDREAHAAVVVAEAHQHPHKAMRLASVAGKGLYLTGYMSGDPRDAEPTARQQYEKAYFRANVVATRPWVIERFHSLVGERALAHVIPKDRAVDIDAPVDFVIAEALIKHHGLS
jgi:N-acylneuraminate cytidylyltransferase